MKTKVEILELIDVYKRARNDHIGEAYTEAELGNFKKAYELSVVADKFDIKVRMLYDVLK